eukprot:g2820.t1 g2820   contig12:860825-862199(-)
MFSTSLFTDGNLDRRQRQKAEQQQPRNSEILRDQHIDIHSKQLIMTRKSKQPGGHNPLTYAERKRLKSSGYGTQSTRLSTESQLPFGHCALGLSPIEGDAVATNSGHIYSREAIVQYLLTKNGELKRQRAEYERQRVEVENRRHVWEEKNRKETEQKFVTKDQGAMSSALVVREDAAAASGGGVARGSSTSSTAKTASGNTKGKEIGQQNTLQHVSYWLTTSQPIHQKGTSGNDGDFHYAAEIEALPTPPPDRPTSPMSGEPLKLKQLIPLHLVHEESDEKKSGMSSSNINTGKVLCAVSHKTITTQPTIAIKTTGQVMLKSVYDELAKPTMTCPVTGKKFKEKDVLELIKGKSGFAASGNVVAKKYNPTLT